MDDYGHYSETKAYGGIYVVFISDITEKKEMREEGTSSRDAVIAALTNNYNTVWLINDVVTEECPCSIRIWMTCMRKRSIMP